MEIGGKPQLQLPAAARRGGKAAALVRFLAATLAVLLAVAAFAGARGASLTPISQPATGASIGKVLEYRLELECPWLCLPARPLAFVPPPGLQLLEPPRIWRHGRLGFGRWRWQVRLLLQPYAVGVLNPGRLGVPLLSLLPGAPETPEYLLPAIEVAADLPLRRTALERLLSPPHVPSKLPATSLPAGRLLFSAAVLAALLAAGLRWWHRPRRRDQAATPAAAAAGRLHKIEADHGAPAAARAAAIRDLVADYLGEELGIAGRGQTLREIAAQFSRKHPAAAGLPVRLADFCALADSANFAAHGSPAAAEAAARLPGAAHELLAACAAELAPARRGDDAPRLTAPAKPQN